MKVQDTFKLRWTDSATDKSEIVEIQVIKKNADGTFRLIYLSGTPARLGIWIDTAPLSWIETVKL